MSRRGLTLVTALAAGACRPSLPSTSAPPIALATAPGDGLARCKVAASQERPLVTEWPASEKASLEAQVAMGGVAVAYAGCTMRVLPQCVVRGQYRWSRTTPATDYLEIKSDDELYAKLPLGAASLEGELARSGELVVQTTVAGYLRLDAAGAASFSLDGRCDEATHVVGGLAVGAFALRSGASSQARASVEVMTASAGGKRSASGELLRQAGEPDRCGGATDGAPDPACASPLQLFLLPTAPPERAAGVGGGSPGAGPGVTRAPFRTTEVPIEVRSADPDISWDVYVDGKRACQTPCDHVVEPRSVLRLHERRSFLSRKSTVTIRDLHPWAEVGGVRIDAHDSSAWSLSGLVRLGGLFYSVIGVGFLIPCLTTSDEDRGLWCTTSGVTFAVGLPLFAAGTWFMDAHGSADTSPRRQ